MLDLGLPIALLAVATSAFAAGHALIRKRRPQSAFGWITVCFTLPFLGPLLYYAFGINRVHLRAKQLVERDPSLNADPDGLSGRHAPLRDGNAVEALHNGEQTFPAMLEAIRAAERRVYLSSYIFETRGIGADFLDALAEAAGRGATVRVLLDGVGELYSRPRASRALTRRGVRFARFLPPRLIPPALRINMRNHRKILVCDETAAFVGGLNIHSRHLTEDSGNANRIVDLHFRFRGPVVADLAATFERDWQFASGETLEPSDRAIGTAGMARCRTIADGPDRHLDPITSMLLAAIGRAERRIAIMTPYFLPPRELVGTLQSAATRGLDVAILLPAKNNLPYVHRATRNMLWELLEHDIRIYYQPPPFVHTKLLLIDDDSAVVGSGNLDPRSLRLNFELAVEIFDPPFVSSLGEHFAAVRAESHPITLAEVDGRQLPTRLLDSLAWLFSPYF
jgi:cardiolipin synthase